MAPDLGRRLLAEAIGTALLVIFGAGAVVAALRLGNGKLDYAGLGIVALSFALVIAMVIYAFGTTSGAHINPAFGPYLTTSVFGGSPPWKDFWIYVVGPIAGGAIAALLYDLVARPGREEIPAAPAAEQGTAGVIEGRRVAPGEGVPVGAPGDSPRGTGRFQGTAGDIEGERD